MSSFAQYYIKYFHEFAPYDWEKRQEYLAAFFQADDSIEFAIGEGDKRKVFNTNAKVVRLRDAIGARIKGTKLTDGNELAEDRPQIDPVMQNEWYYVWKMAVESDLLERKATARAFIAQMLDWFPEVFEEMADEEQKTAFVEKMGKSISREKSKWMQGGQEVPFKDMMSKWPELQLDHNKVKQMFLVCRDLRDALQNLKSAIEQEEAAKG